VDLLTAMTEIKFQATPWDSWEGAT